MPQSADMLEVLQSLLQPRPWQRLHTNEPCTLEHLSGALRVIALHVVADIGIDDQGISPLS